MERFYNLLVQVELKLYEFLNVTYFDENCSPADLYFHLPEVLEAYNRLRVITSDLVDQSALTCKTYTYDQVYWMSPEFVDQVNAGSLADRFVLLAEAVSCWDSLHFPRGDFPPCPLLAFEDLDHSVEGVDF